MAPLVNRRILIVLDFFSLFSGASAASIGGVAQATKRSGRREVRSCGCRWGRQRHQTRKGAWAGTPLPGLPAATTTFSCQRSDRVPETRPCPLPANQSERADLGERCGGVVTPAARVVRVRQQLGRRAAVASSLRATLHDSPRRSCGRPIKAGEVGSSDARKHRGILRCKGPKDGAFLPLPWWRSSLACLS